MSRVGDIVNHQNSLSFDLGSDWLGYLWLLCSNSYVRVKLDLHIGKIRVFQEIAHDSSRRPAASGDSHDDLGQVTYAFDLSGKFYHHVIDVVPARRNIFPIQKSQTKELNSVTNHGSIKPLSAYK